jgi:hypothetical protein
MLDERTGIDFPFFQSEVLDMFGRPDENGPFAKKFLRVIDLSEFSPYFDHVVDYQGNSWNYKVYGNWIIEEPLKRAFSLLVARGLAQEIQSYEGCAVYRPPRGGGMRWSMHAFGLALDFNASTNEYGQEPSMPHEVVRCFAECGWEWGGLWTPDKYRDGMHFQLVWVRQRTDGNPLNPVAWAA